MCEWRIVPGHDRYAVSERGEVVGPAERVLTPMRTGARRPGAQRSKVRLATTPRIDADVAHLVLEAFVCARPAGAVAMHRNDDTTDNRAANLVWGNPKDNAVDCSKKGRSGGQRLTLLDKRDALSYAAQGVRSVDIATFFGVSQQRVCDVLHGRAVV